MTLIKVTQQDNGLLNFYSDFDFDSLSDSGWNNYVSLLTLEMMYSDELDKKFYDILRILYMACVLKSSNPVEGMKIFHSKSKDIKKDLDDLANLIRATKEGRTSSNV